MRLTYSALALVVLADQMLLPMFHVAGLPCKPSYLLLGLPLLSRWLDSNRKGWERSRVKQDWQVSGAIGIILVTGLIGEAWLSATQPGVVHGEFVRSFLIYILALLAFSLGQRASRFRFEWLVYLFFISISLNFLFVILQYRLPQWLIDFYYPVGAFDGLTVFDFVRPRGLFGNPNVSAHMISILVLFIHLALRKRLLIISSIAVGLAIIILPVLLAIALATRGEFVVTIILGFLNFKVLFLRDSVRRDRIQRIVLPVGLCLVLVASAMYAVRNSEWSNRFERVVTSVADAEMRFSRERGIARPLLTFEHVQDRFIRSPVFGTGFGYAGHYPFDQETIYYHNDWFRLLVTSGIIGLLAMLWFIWRFAWPLGWPIVIPLILPGMVNTFMLNIPAFICYFLLVGVFRERIARRYAARQLRGNRLEKSTLVVT